MTENSPDRHRLRRGNDRGGEPPDAPPRPARLWPRARVARLVSAAALLTGAWLAPARAASAVEPPLLPPASPSPPDSTAQLPTMITELRTLESAAIRQLDFQQVQGLELEIAPLLRQLEAMSQVQLVGPAGAPAGTPPVSSGGVFSDSRDAAFEAAPA